MEIRYFCEICNQCSSDHQEIERCEAQPVSAQLPTISPVWHCGKICRISGGFLGLDHTWLYSLWQQMEDSPDQLCNFILAGYFNEKDLEPLRPSTEQTTA